MKVSIRRWLGFAALPAALLMLGLSAPAQAASYKCPGATGTFPVVPMTQVTGSIEIQHTDNTLCDIPYDISATSSISINVTSNSFKGKKITSNSSFITINSTPGDVTTEDLTAGTYIGVTAGVGQGQQAGMIDVQGDIVINKLDPQPIGQPQTHGNVLLKAQGSIKVFNISTDGSTAQDGGEKTGAVQIDANMYSGNSGTFVIGGTGASGVSGTISTFTKNGGGNSTSQVLGGVRITNGANFEHDAGGIEVMNAAAINVLATNSRAGTIQLNAQGGDLIIHEGLSVEGNDLASGANGQKSGFMYLGAKKVFFPEDAVLQASQHESISGSIHQVVIATETIDFNGKLDIFVNGKGVSTNAPASVYVVPYKGINPFTTDNVQSLLWQIPFNGTFFQYPGEVKFDGAAISNLTIMADGENTQIGVTGDNIVFNGKDVTVQARGMNHTKHEIVIGYFNSGSYTGSKGLQMNNTGVTLFNVRGYGGPTNSGGDIQIQVDKTELNQSRWNLRAQGGANVGDGGTIWFTTTQISLSQNTLLDFNADAALNGEGFAQIQRSTNGRKAIFFDAGVSNLTLGRGKEKVQFSAKGGGTGGNGGAVEVKTSGTGNIFVVDNNRVVDVSGGQQYGNGGMIKITGQSINFPPAPSNIIFDAKASETNGEGGQIDFVGTSSTSPSPNTIINVNTMMKVDGDSSSNLLISDGVITINDVMCRQFKTAFNYPESYWDCGPRNGSITGQGSTVATAASSLEPQLQNILKDRSAVTPNNKSVQVYAMHSIDEFQDFFNQPTINPVSGVYGISNNPIRVSAAFLNINVGGVLQPATNPLFPASAGSSTIMQASIVHELGHELDYIWGNQSGLSAFTNLIVPDFTNLNQDSMGIQRPCTSAYLPDTCANLASGTPNATAYQQLGYATINTELFPIVFEHLESVRSGRAYGAQPDLDGRSVPLPDASNPGAVSFFNGMAGFVQGLINNPPQSVN